LSGYTPEPRFSRLWFALGVIPLALAAALIFIFLPEKPPLEVIDVLPGEVQVGQNVLVVGGRLHLATGLVLVRDGQAVEIAPTLADESRLAFPAPDIAPGEYALHVRMDDGDVVTRHVLEVVDADALLGRPAFPPPGQKATPGPAATMVEILTSQPWTDTGIILSPGDALSIEVTGSVQYADPDSTTETGPGGTDNPSGGCNYVVTDRSVPAQSVVGNVAGFPALDGTGFYVGLGFEGSVPVPGAAQRSGKLYLGFNDGAVYCDRRGYDALGFRGENKGTFAATITVTR